MPASIFNGNFVKNLKGDLNLNDERYVLSDTVDPTSSAVDAPRGSLLMRDTGAAGELYQKNDNGSTTNWTQVSAGAATADELAVVYEQYGSGVNAGTPGVPGSWHTRSLTGKEGVNSGIVTLASNQFTLGAGIYNLFAQSTFYNTGPTRLNVYNITDAAWQFNGMNLTASASMNIQTFVAGTLNLGSSKTFELRYQVGTATASIGLGSALGFTNTTIEGIERYTQIIIVKVNA